MGLGLGFCVGWWVAKWLDGWLVEGSAGLVLGGGDEVMAGYYVARFSPRVVGGVERAVDGWRSRFGWSGGIFKYRIRWGRF